jgi:hypothetical protein
VPKVIVLFFGAESSGAESAGAAADGAKAVRFTEVDVRAGAEMATGHPSLTPTAVAEYDGMILIAGPGAVPPTLAQMLAELERAGSSENMVVGVAGENTLVLEAVARLGGIIVTAESAKRVGERVAKVAAWVRHGLGHETEHRHEHVHHEGHHEGHHHE